MTQIHPEDQIKVAKGPYLQWSGAGYFQKIAFFSVTKRERTSGDLPERSLV